MLIKVHLLFYSYFKDFIGLAVAAFIAMEQMVTSAIKSTLTPDIIKAHTDMFILYAKFCNHLFIK